MSKVNIEQMLVLSVSVSQNVLDIFCLVTYKDWIQDQSSS